MSDSTFSPTFLESLAGAHLELTDLILLLQPDLDRRDAALSAASILPGGRDALLFIKTLGDDRLKKELDKVRACVSSKMENAEEGEKW